jgi:hypothetical protein
VDRLATGITVVFHEYQIAAGLAAPSHHGENISCNDINQRAWADDG